MTADEPRADEPPLLPDRSDDETDLGWGDEPPARASDQHLRADRPPHWE